MLQGEHSAILSTFIKLPFVIKIFVLSIYEWPLKTGFIVSKLHDMASMFLAHLGHMPKVSYCDHSMSVVRPPGLLCHLSSANKLL